MLIFKGFTDTNDFRRIKETDSKYHAFHMWYSIYKMGKLFFWETHFLCRLETEHQNRCLRVTFAQPLVNLFTKPQW